MCPQIAGQTTTCQIECRRPICTNAQYHMQCQVSLYNRARETKTSEESNVDTVNHGIAFAGLVSCIEDASNDNKTELFSFLAMNAAGINTNKQVITTYHTDVLCTNRQNVLGVASCTHEEANARILLHLEDAVQARAQQSVNTHC